MSAVAEFIEAASVPLAGAHVSGTLDRARDILARDPSLARADIRCAAILGDADEVRRHLATNTSLATTAGGPRGWDPLTHLCFSRFLRIAPETGDFTECARLLLDAGANPDTGWFEGSGERTWESALYGAAGVARHAGVTALLLERGADPNDGETPYHAPESYDNTIVGLLVACGRLTADSLSTMLLRKADWHDLEGMRLLLAAGADPNRDTVWGVTALHQAVRRDNDLANVALLLDHGADPSLRDRDGRSAAQYAAWRGRGDVLALLEERALAPALTGPEAILAACARGDLDEARRRAAADAASRDAVLAHGGTVLALFAGNGNANGVDALLALGVPVDAVFSEGDGYFGVARRSTALHVAAWRLREEAVHRLLRAGAGVNAPDGEGHTPLQRAVAGCTASYWSERRTPGIVAALLKAGATTDGVTLPTGYDEIDALLSGRAAGRTSA